MDTNQCLTKKIEYLRKKMIETGLKNGLTCPTTVKISQELDVLLMTYIKKTHKNH
ncbi:hypothetical protein CJ195_14575 [Bacillus sp. UMB0899]|nr:hypothetical protein CJ195_14575 [Bacillus sp. UMB0899]